MAHKDCTAQTKAEQKLLDELATGEAVTIGDGKRPGPEAGESRQIRATFLRALLLGDCAGADKSTALACARNADRRHPLNQSGGAAGLLPRHAQSRLIPRLQPRHLCC